MEPKPLFRGSNVYQEQGEYLRGLEIFHKAKACYDEAYLKNPEDIKTLIGRGHVCVESFDLDQAYSDAKVALQRDPHNLAAQNLMAVVMHTKSNFEQSLIINYRGARRRLCPSYFLDGIGQGQETIQDCIGNNAGEVMTNFLKLIQKNLSVMVDENEPEKVYHASRLPQFKPKRRLSQLETKKQMILFRVLANKYLGPMAWDKFFLTELSDSSTLKSANAKGSQQLEDLVNESLQMLLVRQEMLRVQRPYYTVKRAEETVSRYQTKFKKQLLIRERKSGARTAELYLNQINKLYYQNNLVALIGKAERMQLFLDLKTQRTLPNKQIYTDKLYSALAKGYLSQYRLSYGQSAIANRRRVAFLLGTYKGRPSSYDSVIYNYPRKFDISKNTLEKYKNKLLSCENDTMKCWLNYEIARILSAHKNYPMSKFHAKRCQRTAEKIENTAWWLNACFILIGGDMIQSNLNEVRSNVQSAREWAKEAPNSERILAFLNECLAMAGELNIIDEHKAIMRREKDILNAIEKNLRIEAEVLFRKISQVPKGRRFSVLPAKPSPKVEDNAVRHRRHQRGISIVPGPGINLPKLPVSKIPGLQSFD